MYGFPEFFSCSKPGCGQSETRLEKIQTRLKIHKLYAKYVRSPQPLDIKEEAILENK